MHGGEAVFLELVDADRNLDAAVVDSVELTVTRRRRRPRDRRARRDGRRLGPVRGLRADARGRHGGRRLRAASASATASSRRRYADPLDAADQATAAALVDPFGLVFDSQTGAPVNGARVRLVVAGSGAPAVVRGDDGVSALRRRAHHGPIRYRCGRHRLRVSARRIPLSARSPPATIASSSSRPTATARRRRRPKRTCRRCPARRTRCCRRRSAPTLTVAGQIAPAVDIPLDPTGSALFVAKSTALDVAAIGDFVPYTVTVRNAGDFAALTNVVDHGPVAGGHALSGALGAPRFGRTARPRARRRRPHLDLPLARARRAAQRRAALRRRRHERRGRQHARQPRDGARRRRHRIEHRQRGRAVARRAVLERGTAARPRLRRHLRHDRRDRRRRRRRPHLPRGRPLRRHRRRRQVPLRRRDAGLARRAARYDHAARSNFSRCAATRACAAPATRRRSSSTCAAARSARPTSSSRSAPHRPATHA